MASADLADLIQDVKLDCRVQASALQGRRKLRQQKAAAGMVKQMVGFLEPEKEAAGEEPAQKTANEQAEADCYHQNLKEIHEAQYKAVVNRVRGEAAQNPRQATAKDFCGNWTDSFGNTVCVYSTDAFKIELVASLSRPPRPDIRLQLRPMDNGEGWFCGKAILSRIGDSACELAWTFPDGKVSVWKRQEEEAEQEEHKEGEHVEAKEACATHEPLGYHQVLRAGRCGILHKPYGQYTAQAHMAEELPLGCLPEHFGPYSAQAAHEDAPVVGYVLMPYLVTM